MSANKYLSMSDEDFLNLPEAQTGIIPEDDAEPAPAAVVEPVVEEQPVAVEPVVEAVEPPAVVEEPEPVVTEPTPEKVEPVKEPPVTPPNDQGNKETNPTPAQVEPVKDEVDYKGAYSKIVGPLKAGKGTIEVKSIEEAQRLMQMGVGYSEKMRELNPHLKTMRMLEKNGLLGNDDQLSFLIDLQQRNPDAIKKLVQESGLDPLEMDMETPSDYRPTNRSVSDREIAFKTELDNLKMVEGGQETIDHINSSWDQASVKELYDNEGAIEVIRAQRQNGTYDQIVNEINRQRALGNIPAGTPFLRAYTAVGDHMEQNKLFKEPTPVNPAPVVQDPPQAQVLATRVATPKPAAANADLVAAATTTKPTAARKGAFVNPAGMSDEEFLKKYGDKY